MSYSCLYSNAIQQFDLNSHVIQRVIAVGDYISRAEQRQGLAATNDVHVSIYYT